MTMQKSRFELIHEIHRQRACITRLKEAESILTTMGYHVTAIKRASVILDDFFALNHFPHNPSDRRSRMLESTRHAIESFNRELVANYLKLWGDDPKQPMALYWEIRG
jgi:hypothetical protein